MHAQRAIGYNGMDRPDGRIGDAVYESLRRGVINPVTALIDVAVVDPVFRAKRSPTSKGVLYVYQADAEIHVEPGHADIAKRCSVGAAILANDRNADPRTRLTAAQIGVLAFDVNAIERVAVAGRHYQRRAAVVLSPNYTGQTTALFCLRQCRRTVESAVLTEHGR